MELKQITAQKMYKEKIAFDEFNTRDIMASKTPIIKVINDVF